MTTLKDFLDEFEKLYLQRLLSLHHGRASDAAITAGISRKCLWQKIRKHGLRRLDYGIVDRTGLPSRGAEAGGLVS